MAVGYERNPATCVQRLWFSPIPAKAGPTGQAPRVPSAGGRRGRGARPGHPPDKHGVGRDTVGRGATQPGGWVSSLPSLQGPGQKQTGQLWAPCPPGASAGRGRGAEVTSAETQGGGPAKGTATCGTPEMPVLAARGVGGWAGEGRGGLKPRGHLPLGIRRGSLGEPRPAGPRGPGEAAAGEAVEAASTSSSAGGSVRPSGPPSPPRTTVQTTLIPRCTCHPSS